MPKVSIEICKNCPRLKKCPDYRLFKQPLLFSGTGKEGVFTSSRKKRYKTPEKTSTPSHEEQLTMNFMMRK
ncbi:MAG: hypothetical protein JXL81_10570 [Deltaproteobacteria bacterium]|nr:hypothetical protein [Deltaproteobacteria bacterium]